MFITDNVMSRESGKKACTKELSHMRNFNVCENIRVWEQNRRKNAESLLNCLEGVGHAAMAMCNFFLDSHTSFAIELCTKPLEWHTANIW